MYMFTFFYVDDIISMVIIQRVGYTRLEKMIWRSDE